MTRNDVTLALMRTNLYRGSWVLDDLSFDGMSQAFVEEAWREWVQTLPDELAEMAEVGGGKSIRCPRWLPEVFDCDSIARSFAEFVSRCMAVDAVRTNRKRGNAAFGKLNFSLDGNPAMNHAVNWFIDHDLVARVFDAARCVTRNLTAVEIPTVVCGESC